jgi:hypothetical protein
VLNETNERQHKMNMRSRVRLGALAGVLILGLIASASASAHQWQVNGVEASGQEVVISGGVSTLTWGTKKISCTATAGKGTVKTKGAGEAAEIKFTGCSTSQSGCSVRTEGQPAGTILAANLPTALTEREPSGGGKAKLADEFKSNAVTKEIAKLKFEGTCSEFPNGVIAGEAAATLTNLSGGIVELRFPTPQLEENTLNFFGKNLTIATVLKEQLAGGGTLTAS